MNIIIGGIQVNSNDAVKADDYEIVISNQRMSEHMQLTLREAHAIRRILEFVLAPATSRGLI